LNHRLLLAARFVTKDRKGQNGVNPVDRHRNQPANAMPMKNPPHPGVGLKDDIEALGLSVADAAVGLDVTRQQLYRILRGESAISPEMAIRLEKGIGGTAEGWLRMQAAHDLARARKREFKVTKFRRPPAPEAA
jgi:addiction module HigA family antidote